MSLNCRPGDLARVYVTDPTYRCIQDCIVKLKDEPYYMLNNEPYWDIEEPLMFVAPRTDVNARGRLVYEGETVPVHGLPDRFLRPIRGMTGEDQILRIAGKPQEVAA